MKRILISPYSKGLRKFNATDPDNINPKNYPYWKEVVAELRKMGYYVIQVGVVGEEPIGANEVKFSLSLKDLRVLLSQSDTWISVDNFFNHFATYYKKKGIVVFGQSDPNIFGYPQNINLLKDRSYLRPDQTGLWESVSYKKDAFVDPGAVISAVQSILG